MQVIRVSIPDFGIARVCSESDELPDAWEFISTEGEVFLDKDERSSFRCKCTKCPEGFNFATGVYYYAMMDAFNLVVRDLEDNVFVVCRDDAIKYFDIPLEEPIGLPHFNWDQRLYLGRLLNILLSNVMNDNGLSECARRVAGIIQNSIPISAESLGATIADLDWLDKYGDDAVRLCTKTVRDTLVKFLCEKETVLCGL